MGRDKLGVWDEQIIVILAVVYLLSRDRLFATPWTVACQAPLCMGFPRQEYWSELPFPIPGDLPDPGIEPISPALAGRFLTTAPPGTPGLTDTIYSIQNGLPWYQLVKNPPAMRETWARSLGWEDPLEKGKATYSSILAWRIPWTV